MSDRTSLLWRRLRRHRLLLAALTPVLALVAFSATVVADKLQTYRDSAELLVSAQVSRTARSLAREVEVERALAAAFVASDRTADRSALDHQRARTDDRAQALRMQLAQPATAKLFGDAGPAENLGVLDQLRAATDGDGQLFELNEGYSWLLALLAGTATRMHSDELSLLAAAFVDLGAIKDRLSRQAVLGAAWLDGGAPDTLAGFVTAGAERRAFMESFRSHAPAELLRDYSALVASPDFLAVEDLHRRLADDHGNGLAPAAWQQAHARLAQRVTEVEDKLAAGMEARIEAQLNWAKAGFYLVVVGVVVLVAFSLETLRRSERRAVLWEEEARKLFRAVEQSPVAVMIADPKGDVEYVNPAFTKLTQYGRDEMLGRNPRILRSDQTPREYYAELWRTISAGLEWRGEIMNRRKDGTTYWERMTIAPVKGPDGAVDNYIALKEDITERKQVEEATAAAHEAAELANRAKSEFLATMSHELRTPLNAIIGFSEIMEQQLLGPVGQPQYVTYAKDINESGRALLQLINDILDVSRLEMGRVAMREDEVPLGRVLVSVLTLLNERAEQGEVSIVNALPADLPALWADERRLKQILVNVIGNAIKFTPPGGRATITATAGPGGLDIVVEDTGIGIAPQDITKVMGPFGQADSGMARRYDGSGLGLPLSRKLMGLHDGTLSLESRLGAGTRVILHFPPERVRAPA